MENLLRLGEGRIGYPPEQGERLVPGRVPDRAVTTLPHLCELAVLAFASKREPLETLFQYRKLAGIPEGVPARANDPSAAWSSEKSVLNYDRLAVNDGLCGIIEGPRYF